MSDVLKELASGGLDQAINIVDKSSEGAIEALNQVRGAVADVATSGVNVSDKVTEDLIVEINDLRGQLLDRLRAAKDSLLLPLEALP